MRSTLTLLLSLALAPAAYAQSEDDVPEADRGRIKYQERTVIDFEAVDVTGELVKPQGQLLLERKRADFNPIIRFREDFNAEMKASIDQVK